MGRLQTLRPKIQTLKVSPAAILTERIDATPRMRGRPGMRRRAEWLQRHPLCEPCKHEARTSAARVVDHTIPLWAGGADDYDTNGRSMCRRHHDAKTACEAAMRAAGGWMATPCTCGQHGRGAPKR